MSEVFCQNLKRIRISQRYSQCQLGEAIGTSQATYNKYEKGLVSPTLRTIIKIVNVLGVPIEEFFKDCS